MKAITYIFMLGAISMQVLPSAYSSLLQLRKCIAKLVAEENLHQEQLLTLRVHHSDIRWIEEGRELVYNHQFYDVKSYHSVGDSILFTGLGDVEETAIEVSIDKVLKTPVPEKPLQVIGQNIIEFTASLPPSCQLAIGHIKLSPCRAEFNHNVALLYSYPAI